MVIWVGWGVRRLLYAILGLLLCLICIAARADELPVIRFSEAARYAGEHVAVRGLVASVTTSPLGTAFINFGGEYPNQTFAGFISAESKLASDGRLSTLQGKIVDIIGTIVLYEGKPEIEVLSADQIRIFSASAGSVIWLSVQTPPRQSEFQ
jgi:DNA/RNA endonuclease YhcR with UshA esterase domain